MDITVLQLELREGYERRDRARRRGWLIVWVLSLMTLVALWLFA